MNIDLFRYNSTDTHTAGMLLIDGKFACYTIENPHNEPKVNGNTRIPMGTYRVGFRQQGGFHQRYSSKFSAMHQGMIEVKDVPNFTNILMHIGNSTKDTDGCILVGSQSARSGRNFVYGSTIAYKKIYLKIRDALIANETVNLMVIDYA